MKNCETCGQALPVEPTDNWKELRNKVAECETFDEALLLKPEEMSERKFKSIFQQVRN
jgi:hypothetical protein